jgi:hypoxanthine phosphoribosyltransferase
LLKQVHKLCKESAEKLLADFQPHLMVAIGGGGYVPARILRSFLKKPGSPNIPIQAIGLSLYEALGNDSQVETLGTKVTRTQWLDLSSLGEMENLIGKRVLIVDEVDDTRTTLEYAVKELEKDVELARERLGGNQPKAEFSIFVLHVSRPGVTPRSVMLVAARHTDFPVPCRTRISKRRVFSPTTWSLPDVIWLPAPSETSGSATPGRPSTSRSMTGSPRRTATRSRRLWERDDKRKT